ncbi:MULTISPECIES: helix-turn-helix transcriptional regulator [unclassified Streptomyces]|uniref:helix-turn-helix domain-containing protein n=1 Tax=unclassified Streptomyces TaxID=2593676 RepID=UPI0033A73FF6
MRAPPPELPSFDVTDGAGDESGGEGAHAPGWKALPEELDPEARAFTERIRRLIDRSGPGVVAVAGRTGRERSAWDAYLNARRPVPRGAVLALAEVTGADPADLTDRWERARVGTAAVEVRHSAARAASWARITGAAPGDTVSVEAVGAPPSPRAPTRRRRGPTRTPRRSPPRRRPHAPAAPSRTAPGAARRVGGAVRADGWQ